MGGEAGDVAIDDKPPEARNEEDDDGEGNLIDTGEAKAI